MPTIVAANDPEAANRAVERILAGEQEETQPAPRPLATLPSSGDVTLPCGYYSIDTGLVRDAEVRELTGYDEEALAKAIGPAEVMQLLLERAVVRIGDRKPSKSDLDSLLTGDADTLMLAIRRVTYGNTASFFVTCSSCGQPSELALDLVADIPVEEIGVGERKFTVDLKCGSADVRLPDWEGQRALGTLGEGTTDAEMATRLLRNCVESINGMPVVDTASILSLKAADRATLVEAITSRVAGTRLNKAKKACPACEEVIPMPLTVAALFPFGR